MKLLNSAAYIGPNRAGRVKGMQMKLPTVLDRFLNDHSGAITAEWAVLSASVLALALIVMTSIAADDPAAPPQQIAEVATLGAG